MNTGTVKFFNLSKGFGFISKDSGEDIFFHITGLRESTINSGDKVRFDISEGRKGPLAVNVENL